MPPCGLDHRPPRLSQLDRHAFARPGPCASTSPAADLEVLARRRRGTTLALEGKGQPRELLGSGAGVRRTGSGAPEGGRRSAPLGKRPSDRASHQESQSDMAPNNTRSLVPYAVAVGRGHGRPRVQRGGSHRVSPDKVRGTSVRRGCLGSEKAQGHGAWFKWGRRGNHVVLGAPRENRCSTISFLDEEKRVLRPHPRSRRMLA